MLYIRLRSVGVKALGFRPIRNASTQLVSIPIVGRPNVGKSTLFNRLTAKSSKRLRRHPAIVSPFAGTTRDRRDAPANIAGAEFIAIDTGGLEDTNPHSVNGHLNAAIAAQVETAVQRSKVALFVIDAREGVTPLDRHFALWARKQPNPIDFNDDEERKWIILLNKAEGIMSRSDDGDDEMMNQLSLEVKKLGLGDNMLFISAQNGDGFGTLAASLLPYIEQASMVRENNGDDNVEKDDDILDNKGVLNDDVLFEHLANESSYKNDDDDDDETDQTETKTSKWDQNSEKNEVIELAIVGRPNVGKSSLVNSILSTERVCVGPMPGVTRDSIPIDWEFQDRKLRLVDTAGIRKYHVDKSRDPAPSPWSFSSGVEQTEESANQELLLKLEQQSIAASLKSLGLASVVVMVLDGSVGEIRRIELSLASKIMDEGRALVIAANKADLLPDSSLSKYKSGVEAQAKLLLPQHGNLPVVPLSALTGEGVNELLPAVIDAHDRWSHRVNTGLLNRWLYSVQKHHPPKARKTVSGAMSTTKLKYITQLKGRPPTFVIFVNNADSIRGDFLAYLKNNLRDEFGYHGIPMRILLRSTGKTLKSRLAAMPSFRPPSKLLTSVTLSSETPTSLPHYDNDGDEQPQSSSSSSPNMTIKKVTVNYSTTKQNKSKNLEKKNPSKLMSKEKRIAAKRKALRGGYKK